MELSQKNDVRSRCCYGGAAVGRVYDSVDDLGVVNEPRQRELGTVLVSLDMPAAAGNQPTRTLFPAAWRVQPGQPRGHLHSDDCVSSNARGGPPRVMLKLSSVLMTLLLLTAPRLYHDQQVRRAGERDSHRLSGLRQPQVVCRLDSGSIRGIRGGSLRRLR